MPTHENPIGNVTVVNGDARAVTEDGSVRILAAGDPVFQGDVVETSSGAALEITFADGMVLSQGADSIIELDTYVYDPEQSTGEVVFEMVQGTFRSVTGEVVEMNPEGFHLESPLATIGIRGTTTGHYVPPGGGAEQHVLLLYNGKPVVIESPFGGPQQVLTTSGLVVLADNSGLGDYYSATPQEVQKFQEIAHDNLLKGESESGQEEEEGEGGGSGSESGEPDGSGPEEGQPEIVHHGISVLTPEGGVVVVAGGVLVTIPVADLEEVSDTTVGEILEGLLSDGVLPPEASDALSSITDQALGEIINNTLNLSGASESMHVDLAAREYYPVADSNNPIVIPDNIVNVVGATDYNNYIAGDDNDNIITGGEFADDIYGQGGDDLVYMNSYLDSSDLVQGGSGTDTLSFTQSDSDPANALDGVSGFEYIVLGKADTHLSLSGSIMASASDTTTIDGRGILGGEFSFDGAAETNGNFYLVGSAGNSTLIGGSGNDTIEGGTGSNVLNGGGGTNTLSYASALAAVGISLQETTALGAAASDSITWSGFQNVTGSEFGDTIEARLGEANHVQGLGGNDQIIYSESSSLTAGGMDTLDGGSGNDTFFFDRTPTAGTIIMGGDGTDYLESDGDVDFSYASVLGIEKIQINDGAYAKFNDIQVEDSGWTVIGDTGSQELKVQMTGSSVNLANLQFDNWTVGDDTVFIYGTAADESIIGSSMNDYITPGGGVDHVDGGAGNDTMAFSTNAGAGSHIDGGAGTDVLAASGTVDMQDVTGIENIEVIQMAGNSNLSVSAHDANGRAWAITGGSGDTFNVYSTSSGEDKCMSDLDLSGFTTGTFKYFGEGGNDTIRMGQNLLTNVYVDGGAGNDTLTLTENGNTDALDHVSNVEHIIVSDAATEIVLTTNTLVQSGGTVTIDGSSMTHALDFDGSGETDGDLVILGGSASDTIVGGSGDDTINGGDGGDSLDGGPGSDFVSYEGSDAAVTVYIDGLNTNSGGWAEGDILSGLKGVIATSYDDYLYGSSHYGTTLYGMDGDDTLEGEGADNTLCGGAGSDSIEVGTGFDTILYESYSEVENDLDTITGFTSGMDKLVFNYQDFIGLKGDLDPVVNFFTSLNDVKSSSCFIFENNILYYDDDGSGSTNAVAIAYFDGGTVDIDDIEIV